MRILIYIKEAFYLRFYEVSSELKGSKGSPVSPLLIHSFINLTWKEFEKMEFILPGSSELTRVIYYARYADDMLFGIPILGAGRWSVLRS